MHRPVPPRARVGDVLSLPWFLVSVTVFIALGLVLKTRILNWIYGPLFPLFFLYLLPTGLRHIYRLPRTLLASRGAAARSEPR